jgi:ABC-2 type transport system permease protein
MNLGPVLDDVREGWTMRSGWIVLSNQSLGVSYRRTTLGPFWITLQQLIFVFGLSLIYGQLFDVDVQTFLPVVAVGVTFWSLISGLLMSSVNVYINGSSHLKSSNLPPTFFIFQSVFSALITFAHSALVLLLLPFLFHFTPTPFSLISTPFILFITLINGVLGSMWLSALSARFRDIRTFIPSVLQISFFLSPVFWSADQITERQWIVNLNPFAWLIESLRSPLIGQESHVEYWLGLIGITLINVVLALVVYGKTRHRLAYWV